MPRSALSPHEDRPAEAISVDVVVTLDDQVAFADQIGRDPELAHWRRIAMFAAVLFLPLFLLVTAVLIAWLLLPTDDFAALLRDRLGALLTIWAVLAGAFILFCWLRYARRGGRQRWEAALVLRGRSGIDPADPQLHEAARCSFGPAGFRSDTASADICVPWPAVAGLTETDTLLIVRTGRLGGFVLPRRDLTDDQLATIRRIVTRHAGG